ncbi:MULTISPECIES: VLRF1 family aeRF1-type release factor [unclassified Streptosporangium]|uniref:VLRF1 family aeRF1-type release factor n=1 Tax=unclassified Streptosporangium TaxID=2632669 RepID=UPI002E2B9AE3|nr:MULTISPECIES: VLRF1 family aeRF1-type release factor [unclassified Streptosporangium]
MRFDRDALREVVSIGDELGVLSFYVNVDPHEETQSRPACRIRFGNELADLRERVTADQDRTRRTAVLKRLEDLEADFRLLLNPYETGVGRVMFAPVSGDETRVFSFQLPVADQIVLEPTAYVRPLVNTVETAPSAGLVVVSRDGVRIIDYRYGQAQEAGRAYFDVSSEDWRETRGPALSEFSQQGPSQRDRFERRVEDNVARIVRGAAPRVTEQATTRDWTVVVLIGDVQLTKILAEELTGDVIQVDAVVDSLSAAKVAEYVEPQLRGARTRFGTGLAIRARDAALSGGRGALGLRDTTKALNESRVARLLLDECREWRGGRAAEGLLYPPDETPPEGLTLVEEHRMGERMIERVLDIDAEVIVLDREASEVLADVDGVGAILRW